MTSRAKSFAPPNALTIWRDARNIFVEFPGPGEESTILSFPCTTIGLSKALSLLVAPPDVAGPQVTYTPPRAIKRVGTFTQHTLAESILRKRGILK